MNIRKRLRISNALMIVVPAIISACVGIGIAVAAWYALAHGVGIGVDDREDFFQSSDAIAEVASGLISTGSAEALADSSALEPMLDSSGMSLVVSQDGETVYSYGDITAEHVALLDAAAGLTGNVQVSSGELCLSARDLASGGHTYRIYVLGLANAGSETVMKLVLVIALAALAVVLVAAVVVTNRFLTLFVLRHVTDPLDLLAKGTRQIRDGNLSYRLPDDRDDEFAPVFGDFNDMARRLADSVERDRRTEERRRTLLVGLSHDLRSPLTSIQAYAEGLLDGVAKTPEARRRYLEMIVGKTGEMRALLGKISTVAKMDGDDGEPANLRVASLDELVGAWVEGNRRAYELRGVLLETRLSPAVVLVDRDLMTRALANLIDNCAVHARPDGDTCRVLLSCAHDAKGWARLVVEDDGPGAPEGSLPHLFDLFYQANEARNGEGNGIGLAVVALAMERMGGTAEAGTSSLGGLQVTLRFPPVQSGNVGAIGLAKDAGPENSRE